MLLLGFALTAACGGKVIGDDSLTGGAGGDGGTGGTPTGSTGGAPSSDVEQACLEFIQLDYLTMGIPCSDCVQQAINGPSVSYVELLVTDSGPCAEANYCANNMCSEQYPDVSPELCACTADCPATAPPSCTTTWVRFFDCVLGPCQPVCQ